MLIALEPLISIHLPKGDDAAKLTDAPNGSKQYNNLAEEFCAHNPYYAAMRNEIRERQAKEDSLPPEWRQEQITPQWDKLPDCVKEITKEVFASGATDASTLALVRSMLPRELDIKICDRKGRRHCDISELAPIIDRIKHRRKIAELHGRTLAIFENDRIDESAKADDIALLATLRNGETQTAQTKSKVKQKHRRYPTDSEALAVLQEAKRRKGTKSYSECSNADTINCMITEQNSKWAGRILYGKLKRKGDGKMRERSTPNDAKKAAGNWGKYLSAYLKDYPPKQCI